MAKYRIPVVLLLLIGIAFSGYDISMRSSDRFGLDFAFQLGDFEMSNAEDRSGIIIEDIGRVSNPGDPDLPVAAEYLILSEHGSPTISVDYIATDTLFASPPAPVDVPRFESGEPDGVFPGESPVYLGNGVWPEGVADIQSVGRARGYPLGLMTICPVRYDFGIGAYLIHEKMTISVDFGGKIEEPEERFRSRPFERMLAEYTLNGNVMPAGVSNEPGTYIIISPDNCWDVMTEFAEYKMSRGHGVILKQLSDFGADPTKDDIKDYIQAVYDSVNPAPTFAILVGDLSMSDGTEVPDFNYGVYFSGHGYSLLDGDDYFSDIFYARWPVDNANECRIYASKVKWYETTPTSGGSDWLTRASVVSTYEHAITPVWNVLWVYELFLHMGYTVVDTFFENGSIIPSPSEIAAPINNGLAFIDYRGWAGSNGWWEPEFTVTDVMTLSNNQAFPVITSIVCGTGDYGAFTDPCFGEAWIRAGTVSNPRGAAAFFGTTDHDTHTRYNNPINGGFFLGLLVHDLPYIGQDEWVSKAECLRLHPREDEEVELYFHSYCTLGDPGLMMQRNIPGELEAEHDSVYNGALLTVDVTESGLPIQDAAISLYRIETKEQSFAYTDFMGEAELYVPGSGAGTIVITAYAPFHTTYVDTVEVSGRPGFEITGLVIDDASGGDNDGVLEPNETATLRVTLENYYYLPISPVEAYLWAEHEGVVVLDEFDSTTIAGHSEGDLVFEVEALGTATGGGPAAMKLFCDSRNGSCMLPINIPLPPGGISIDSIRVDDSVGGDGDGTLEPGETGTAYILVANNGDANVDSSAINVYSTSGWLEIADGESVIIPTIPPLDAVWSDGFEVGAYSGAFHGYTVGIEIHRCEHNRLIGTVDLVLGSHNTDDPQGSDDWGYFAYDNTDIASGITPGLFDDISGTGTFVTVDDDEKIEMPLPFGFVFYGESNETLSVCSNGWASPGSEPYFMLNFYNNPIPAPNGPWGTLALFWDDLEPNTGGGIYWESRPVDGEFIVQWDDMGHARYDGVSNTFQLVIFDPAIHSTRTGDSPIEFRYSGSIEDLDTTEEYSTVGIESQYQNTGIEYLYANIYDDGAAPLGDGRSILFTTNCGSALLTGSVDLGGDIPTKAIVSTDLGQITHPNYHGEYRLLELPPGSHEIKCSAPFYFPANDSVTLSADEHDTVDFTLTAIPTPGTIVASQGVISEISINWSPAPFSEEPLTGYRLLKYLAPGGEPEMIELPDSEFNYIDTDCITGRKYFYRVLNNYSGNLSAPSKLVEGWLEISTEVDEEDLPVEFSLDISPNPFNASLRIDVSVPDGEAAKIEIFDVLGKKVFGDDNVIDYKTYVWGGRTVDGRQLPSGLYLIRLLSETKTITKSAVLLK